MFADTFALLIIMLATWLLGSVASLACWGRDRIACIVGFLTAALGALAGLTCSTSLLLNGVAIEYALPSMLPFTRFSLRLDSLGAFFLFILSLVALATSIFSLGYAREYFGRKSVAALGALFNLFLVSMALVLVANNILMFLIVWELMSLISGFLVVFEHERTEAQRAGFLYIVMTHIGTAMLTVSLLLIFRYTNSFEFGAMKGGAALIPSAVRNSIFLLALLGFGTKAGIVPLHIWLPAAHPEAPSNVSALMSGVMIKVAIYAFLRVAIDILGAGPAWWGYLVIGLGALTALVGILYALMEHDLKRLLAYHSVENIGIILLGAGAALLFITQHQPAYAALGLAAALYHSLNHAAFKGLLFMGAGSVLSATHTKDMEKLGGLIKLMPRTALFVLIGSMAISAFPPLNGFVSEWLTYQSLLAGLDSPLVLPKLFCPLAAAGLALTGALAATCFVKAFGITFLGQARSKQAGSAKEAAWPMQFGMGLLALVCILFGILPKFVLSLIDRPTESLTGAGALTALGNGWTVAIPRAGFASVSMLALGSIVLVGPLVALLLARAIGGKTERRRYETWGCGLQQLTSRMQYTATAFTKPLRIIFSLIYQPSREIDTSFVTPYVPRRIRYETRIESVIEKYLYEPIVAAVMAAAVRIRQVQSGSIHAYLAYIFAALVLLLIFAR